MNSDAKHLLFLSQLFGRAADVATGTKHLGRPIGMMGALREVMRGKLQRSEIAPADLEAIPMLLCWLGAELMKAVF